MRLVEDGQFINALPSPRGEANQYVCREYTLPREQERTRIKSWIQSNARFGPVSDTKVCNGHGRCSIEVQDQSLLQDKNVSWIRIVIGIDKFVKESMPIQEEEKASGKPAAKARPKLKPSSTSGWDSTPMEQRQWIDFELKHKNPRILIVFKCQNSLIDYLDTVNKFTNKMMEQSILTEVSDECKKKLSVGTRYWSDEMNKQFANAPHWSIEKWILILAKGGGQKKRFQYCVNPNYSQKFLYFRAIQGHSGRTINPALQDNVRLPMNFTRYVHPRRKRKRIEFNCESWFDSRRSQSRNRQTCCVLHCCESDG